MSEKGKAVLDNLEKALPHIPEAKREYLVGYGDGLAAALEKNKSSESDQKAG